MKTTKNENIKSKRQSGLQEEGLNMVPPPNEEQIEDKTYGMRVRIKLKKPQYPKKRVGEFRNIIRIHYGYNASHYIAFESNIHSIMQVLNIDDIEEFRTKPETKNANHFGLRILGNK